MVNMSQVTTRKSCECQRKCEICEKGFQRMWETMYMMKYVESVLVLFDYDRDKFQYNMKTNFHF